MLRWVLGDNERSVAEHGLRDPDDALRGTHTDPTKRSLRGAHGAPGLHGDRPCELRHHPRIRSRLRYLLPPPRHAKEEPKRRLVSGL